MFTLDKITKMDYPFKEKKGKVTKQNANDWIYMSMMLVLSTKVLYCNTVFKGIG